MSIEMQEFNFDLDRMKKAVEGPTIQFPLGLSREERRKFILDNIPQRDKEDVAPPKPNDLTVEEAFGIVFERYEGALEEIGKK